MPPSWSSSLPGTASPPWYSPRLGRLRGQVADDRDLLDMFEFQRAAADLPGAEITVYSDRALRNQHVSLDLVTATSPVSDVRPDPRAAPNQRSRPARPRSCAMRETPPGPAGSPATAGSCTGCGSLSATRRSPALPRTRTSGSPLVALLTCRIAGVASSYIYTLFCISLTVVLKLRSVSRADSSVVSSIT